MHSFCITLPRPEPRLQAVIVIVIYLIAVRLQPGDTMPLAAGSILGGLLAAEQPSRRPLPDTRDGGR